MQNHLKNQPVDPTWALINKPVNYPEYPTDGKNQLIWQSNTKSLYHRLSPYANYQQGLLKWGKEPFYYVYPDENKGALAYLRKNNFLGLGIGARATDTIRIGKFMVSSGGVGFLLKQFFLQGKNAFPETRFYNPLSTNLAILGFTPQRHIDIGGGFLGGLISLFTGGTNGPISTGAPNGTAGNDALPTFRNYSWEGDIGKGLIRGETAIKAYGRFNQRWLNPSDKTSTGGFLKSLVRTLIPGTFPIKQPDGTKYRADEGSYGIMLKQYNQMLGLVDETRATETGVTSLWFAGSTGIRKDGEIPTYRGLHIILAQRLPVLMGDGQYIKLTGHRITGKEIRGINTTPEFYAEDSYDPNRPGSRYEDSVGNKSLSDNKEEYGGSPMMVQYSYYAEKKDPSQPQYDTKKTDKKSIDELTSRLNKINENITKAGVYSYKRSPYLSTLAPSPPNSPDVAVGYDKISMLASDRMQNKNDTGLFINYYRDTSILKVSSDVAMSPHEASLKLPTAGNFDAINTLEVLDKTKTINKSKLKSWQTWEPYKDDSIALYFYDIVNEKYIPFRSIIKGITESGTATWDETPFIGRADRVYSYGGFTRGLSFTITVVINSITELAPTWQRINYLTTLIKPSNYTKNKGGNLNMEMNRFMVAPMVMLTIGDLYTDQPILIENITTTIPEDASWETQHQLSFEEWKYLANTIKASNVLYGQLPRTVELGIQCKLLEKERAIVGGANFGDAARDENWRKFKTKSTPLHESFVVDIPNTGIERTKAKSEAKTFNFKDRGEPPSEEDTGGAVFADPSEISTPTSIGDFEGIGNSSL